MNKLISLAKALSDLGFKSYSDSLYQLLKSAAPPLEGFVSLHPDEPIGGVEEEDEEGSPVERRLQRMNRRKSILRDRRTRRNFRSEEEEKKDLDSWYASLSSLGDSVILIPFDRTEVDNNEMILYGMASIFGLSHHNIKNYVDLKDKVYLLGGSNFKQGDLETLKITFPSLWADIQAILSSRGLKEEEVVYMLYNQETNPGRLAGFSKDPFYLGHDIGHSVFDSEDSDWEFKSMLNSFISNMFSLYVTEADEELGGGVESAFSEIESEDDESILQAHLGEFFNISSGPEDSYGDVFAAAASGTLKVNIPEYLYLNREYNLPAENKPKAEEIANKVINDLKTYMNSHQQYGTKGSGPLSYYAGYVVLQDI